MHIATIVLIALGLAMDAFAVSIVSGFTIKQLKKRHALLIAFFFGAFQGIMPILGWAGGTACARYVAAYDHWLAFVLLAFIGGRMIHESRRDGSQQCCINPLDLRTLTALSVATSIDAFVIGVTFAVLNVPLLTPVVTISAVTFALCFAGVFIGNRAGCLCQSKVEAAGGVILIAMGMKILIEHLAA